MSLLRNEVIQMLFHTFVKRKYLNDSSCKGSLARGFKSESKYFSGRMLGYQRYLAFLELKGASLEVINAFNECWKEWEDFERKTD